MLGIFEFLDFGRGQSHFQVVIDKFGSPSDASDGLIEAGVDVFAPLVSGGCVSINGPSGGFGCNGFFVNFFFGFRVARFSDALLIDRPP